MFYCSRCWDAHEAGVAAGHGGFGANVRRSRLTGFGRELAAAGVPVGSGAAAAAAADLGSQPQPPGIALMHPAACAGAAVPLAGGARYRHDPACSTEGCTAQSSLEEDVDNPGVFYCTSCWQKWEVAAGPQEAGHQLQLPGTLVVDEPVANEAAPFSARSAAARSPKPPSKPSPSFAMGASPRRAHHEDAEPPFSSRAERQLPRTPPHDDALAGSAAASPAKSAQRRQRQEPADASSHRSASSPQTTPLGAAAAQKPETPVLAPCGEPTTLWIFHDLPNFTPAIQGKQMEMILETKAQDGRGVLLLKGTIEFAACTEGPAWEGKMARGGHVMRVTQLVGFQLKKLPREDRGDFGMLNMDASEGEVFDGSLDAGAFGRFLEACGDAIKVILNPTRDGSWFPYTDLSSGRALPPASRSAQGVGYFKMGDDMSQNGGAFLSTDGGVTYVRAPTLYGQDLERAVEQDRMAASGGSTALERGSRSLAAAGPGDPSGAAAALGEGAKLLARLESGAFYTLVNAASWKQRHQALGALLSELAALRQSAVQGDKADFAAAIQWTSGECARMVGAVTDACANANVHVAGTALRCFAEIGCGLGDLFRSEARQVLPLAFKKLTERSRTLITVARDCLTSIVDGSCLEISHCFHELQDALDARKNRSSVGRANVAEWSAHWLRARSSLLSSDTIQQLASIMVISLDDSSPAAKKGSASCLLLLLEHAQCPGELPEQLKKQASHSVRASNKLREIMAQRGIARPVSRGSRAKMSLRERVAKAPPASAAAALAGAAAASSSISQEREELARQKFEVAYMLNAKVKTSSEQDLAKISARSEAALAFLDDVSSLATKLGQPKGKVSRWLLPFDSNTNINDQSKRRPPSPRTQASFREIEAQVAPARKEKLVAAAMDLRSFVRIKVSRALAITLRVTLNLDLILHDN